LHKKGVEGRGVAGDISIVSLACLQIPEGIEYRGPVVEGQLSYLQRKRLLYDIVQGVQHVHKEGGIIRDLKPQNVLLKWEGGTTRSIATLIAKLAGGYGSGPQQPLPRNR
jgi:serine/threonine protein kinase